ncbi:MAG TPA: TolC family protein [Bryobacteraceae bacterium]|nr:TolC family protein [Bryobacteraceae bacterium]
MRFSLFFIATCLFAQFGPPASQGQSPRANQLPLSGSAAANGSVTATESPVPGTTTSVNTINPQVQVQGAFAGSAEGRKPFTGKLSLRDAIDRALAYNLGSISLSEAERQAHGELRIARSALLPNVNGYLSETVEQINLEASGIRFHIPIPGVSIPAVVGPFNYFDLRATLTQTVADMTEWNNRRSAQENLRASQLSARDARDLVVLAAGGAYLQVIAAAARVQSSQAQLETAQALYSQASQQHNVGLVAQIDVNRSRIQMLTEQQRLTSLQNDLAKQKINLARITGLPPNNNYDLADDVPFSPASAVSLDDALKQAFAQRSDLKSAEAQVRAAERARAAARDERLPSLSLSANYGAIGENPSNAHGTFDVTGTLNFPIWQGGHIEGDIEQADAALAQRQAEIQDLRGRVEGDVRNAYLDLEAARSQVEVSQQNLQVAQQNLDLTRQRYDAGVADNVDVVQSQESVATAQLDYINSVFAHNVAKLSLARAMGQAADKWMQSLEIRPR